MYGPATGNSAPSGPRSSVSDAVRSSPGPSSSILCSSTQRTSERNERVVPAGSVTVPSTWPPLSEMSAGTGTAAASALRSAMSTRTGAPIGTVVSSARTSSARPSIASAESSAEIGAVP